MPKKQMRARLMIYIAYMRSRTLHLKNMNMHYVRPSEVFVTLVLKKLMWMGT